MKTTALYKGKDIDTMSLEELKIALKALSKLYTDLLHKTISEYENY